MDELISKRALIEYYCKRDCGMTREECTIGDCHEIGLIEEFPSAALGTNLAEVGTDLISRQAAIDSIRDMQAFEDDNGQSYLYLDEVMAVFTDEEELPSAQPEPLTDKEQRIFLAAMERERKICKEVDDQYVHEPYEVLLTKVCDEIERKVKKVLWT